MMPQWYVWLVGNWVHLDSEPKWAIVGAYSSRRKAEEAAWTGCYIAMFAMDDTAQDAYEDCWEMVE